MLRGLTTTFCRVRVRAPLTRASSSSCGAGISLAGQGKVVVIETKDSRIRPKYDQIFTCQRPVLFKNYISHWPATSWLDDIPALQVRLQLTDENDTVVPVELNGSYMSGDMQQAHVGLSSLLGTLDMEMKLDGEEKGLQWYVAQLELKDISPMLVEEDTEVPEMCRTGKGDLYRTNIWLNGTSGSSSDCHQDPFNNLLCQLHGTKTVTLYDPASAEALYPAINTAQKNTSTIDFAHYERQGDEFAVDEQRYPLYHDPSKRTRYGPVTLEPGDALFIPHRYWHYVRAPNVSASVNFWWL